MSMTVKRLLPIASLRIVFLMSAASVDPYRESIEAYRKERVAKLTADGGWLTVDGLLWLKPGSNRAGTDPKSDLVLPEGSAPAHVGVFRHRDGKTSFEAAPGVAVTLDGKSVSTVDLRHDIETSNKPDQLAVGSLRMFVIKRGDEQRGWRYAIRLYDMNSPMRRDFKGIHYFPLKPQVRFQAKWIPHTPPKKIPVLTIIGDTEMSESPGVAEFTHGGTTYRLEPIWSGKRLFFIFKDPTAGKKTYGAGRFLYAEPAKDGVVDLDFNRAENPPCAFTPYATCPLPPKQNQLPFAIEAGELAYHY